MLNKNEGSFFTWIDKRDDYIECCVSTEAFQVYFTRLRFIFKIDKKKKLKTTNFRLEATNSKYMYLTEIHKVELGLSKV